jgi:protein phosphatase
VFTIFSRKENSSNKREKEYQNNDDVLDSLSDIGLSRGNNEDSVITVIHPNNHNLKLLAVADGVGGKECGEMASNFAVSTLEKWFLNLSENHINNSAYISRSISQMIKFINNYLYIVKSYRTGCGTTLTCAVINEKDTIIANIGDSRAYIVKDEEMKQVTRDDSLVWYYYELGEISKDEIRFHRNSRLITKSIGPDINVDPEIVRISNRSYDGIFLFTDGVTDCLSDSKIKKIVTNCKKDCLAKEIIKEAVYGKPAKRAPKGKEFYIPKNGKDNASVALYLKTS